MRHSTACLAATLIFYATIVSSQNGHVNIQDVSSTSVRVGFSYKRGAARYLISAKEWVDGRREQTVSTSEKYIGSHGRSTTLTRLVPGREYLIQVQAIDKRGRPIGLAARKVVTTLLRCFTCNGRASNKECNRRNAVNCPLGTDACLNEMRYQNGIITFTKRCAQFQPQLSRQIQNGRDVTLACRGVHAKDAVCKCMCKSDACNRAELPCNSECFETLPAPVGGKITCTKGKKVNSLCRWSCPAGTSIRGLTTSRCRADRTWSVLTPPKCMKPVNINFDGNGNLPPKKETFNCPKLTQPTNGKMSCTSEHKTNSVCSFSCNRGFVATRGSATRRCLSNGRWTGSIMSCRIVTCPKPPVSNRLIMDCDDGYKSGSVCELSCLEPLTLNGVNRVMCLKTGRWSKRLPSCERRGCIARPRVSANVIAECHDYTSPVKGATCQYSCKMGYRLQGLSSITCTNDRWSNPGPKCVPVRCQPPLGQPTYGLIRCSNSNNYRSQCTFSCNPNYVLSGASTVTCRTTGSWSAPAPFCARVSCPPLRSISFGQYSCNKGRDHGSVCSFRCIDGYGFSLGSQSKVKCVAPEIINPTSEFKGRWSPRIPTCELIRCPVLSLRDKLSIRCTNRRDYRALRSTCTFSCAPGYYVRGRRSTVCGAGRNNRALGRWSNALIPTCQRRRCRSLPLVRDGRIACTESTYSGSVCTVRCNHGYSVKGNPNVECRNDGRWSRRLPRCTRIICRVPFRPTTKHLIYVCRQTSPSNTFYLGHQCPLTCRTGYTLKGPENATCGEDQRWIIPQPISCIDTNECLVNNGGCDQICENTVGSFLCHCRENYKLEPDGRTCRLVVCPPLSNDPLRVLECSNDRRIASTCVISCVEGYEPVGGAAEVTCRRDGTWNQVHGTCQRIKCPSLRAPSNGDMECTNVNLYESMCSHSCNQGYELVGAEEITCTSRRLWTNSQPKCSKIQCSEDRTALAHGRAICTDSNFYLSECRYFCNAGYQFEGRVPTAGRSGFPTGRCLSNRTWSSPAVTCVKKLCTPAVTDLERLRPNGVIACTDANRYESTCAISCPTGYRLFGHSRVTCTEQQTWTYTLGYCGKIQCLRFTDLRAGSIVCTEENLFESVCTFACSIGHNLIGASTSTCRADRTWSSSAPRCQRVTCAESRLFARNGKVTCTDENFYNTQCLTSCNAGYEFNAATVLENTRKNKVARLNNAVKGGSGDVHTSRCLDSGEWDTAKPVCVKHNCAPPAAFLDTSRPNGVVTCTDGERYLSECTIRCDVGYEIVTGTESTQCGTERQWISQLGRCARVKCTPFTTFHNGVISCSNSFLYESVCDFSCNAGYELVGEASSTCQADRTFTNVQPFCQKVTCPATHLALENGNATCTDAARFESRCSYVCNPGYEMISGGGEDSDVVVITCRADRTWEGSLPECRRKQCSKHDGALSKAKLNGRVECTESVWFGSSCTVTCNAGYRLVGSATTSCTASADWAPTIGYCEKIECPVIPIPSNSVMTCTDAFRFESVCTFECVRGYELIGSVSTTCQANKTYDNSSPFCKEIICPETFLALTNGQATCTDSNRYASVCTYVCDDGYKLTSQSAMQATCLMTYKWDAEQEPACEKKRCSQGDPILLKALEHGTMSCTDSDRFQSVCTITCNTGYVLTEGVGSTQCKANQKWEDSFGFCIKKRCTAFPELENGQMSCTEENKFDSLCSFTCNAGYELVGEPSSRCQADQTFTNPLPSCRKKTCPETHLSIENGNTSCTESNLFESVCSYQCVAGYELTSGNASVTCGADQDWSAAEATCEKKICDSNSKDLIRAELHGRVTCTEGHLFNSICSVVCDTGYRLVTGGAISTRCNEEAQWEPAIGHCVKKECPQFEVLSNGVAVCSEANLYLSSCDFDCSAGYEMEGSSSSVCQANRTWTTPLPSCSRVSCPDDYLLLDNGAANCTLSNKYESVCNYTCDRGYEMSVTDAEASTCTQSRTWTHSKPTCSKKKCPLNDPGLVKAQSTGNVTCTEDNLFESVCVVTCPVGYELIGGESEITCLDTENWDNIIGFCQKIDCGTLDVPPNSDMECTDGSRYQSVCDFICHEGYYMEGVASTRCEADRTYSESVPQCRKINCTRDHLSIEFGTVACSEENLFQSTCTYRCNTGYRFFDVDYVTEEVLTSTCLSNAEWSEQVPICEKVTCSHEDEAFVMAHEIGVVNCTESNRYGSTCILSCNEGSTVVGQTSIKCTSSGSWNDTIGHCVVNQCPLLNEPSYGDLSCSNGNDFSSQCDVSCQEGYRFTNETRGLIVERDARNIQAVKVHCRADASWSVMHVPQCEPKPCPVAGWTTLQHGQITCTNGIVYPSECKFQCDPGYEVIQPADNIDVTSVLVTCTSDGKWSLAEPPLCRKVKCLQNVTELQQSHPHGEITCTDDSFYLSECTLRCHKGYHLAGEFNTTQCQNDKEWSVVLESCKKNSCVALEAPRNGSIKCTDSFLFKSHCFITCDPGYEIVDPEDEYDEINGISCRSDGSWCGDIPQCTEIKCPMAKTSIEHGSVNCTNANIYMSECRYSCDVGYHMVQGQSEVITCGVDKRWSDHAPVCENNRCPANDTSLIEARMNGDVTCTNENKFGSRCLLKCYDGYEMSGEPTTTCLYDGDWSNGLGLCQRIACEQLQPVPHSSLQCSNEFLYQSLCYYKCQKGYDRVVPNEKQGLTHDKKCEADGQWAGQSVECRKKTCPAAGYQQIEHGRVQCTDERRFGTRCMYICNAGYELQRPALHDSTMAVINCTANGTWDMEPPVCVPSQCSPTVQELRQRVANGTIDCTNGSSLGSLCTLKCECGYRLNGEASESVCGKTGTWWPMLSNCQRIECPKLRVPDHTNVECSNSYLFDSTCRSTGCDPGYVLSSEDDDLITCAGNGEWLGSLPACKKVQCSEDRLSLTNGNVICTDGRNSGSTCDVHCIEGYVLTSLASWSTRCTETGNWTGPQPVCARRTSCSSTYFPFGNLNCNEGKRCQLSCGPGTVLVGAGESMCNDRVPGIVRWNPPIGLCRKLKCPSLPPIPQGTTVCSDNTNYGSSCRFRCNERFRLVGSMTSRCRADTRWSENVPQCVETTCPMDFLDISNGRVSASDSARVGSVIIYTCSGGYDLLGPVNATCRANGVWSKTKPSCQLSSCPPVRITNGQMECTGSKHNEQGSVCTFRCDKSYELQGNTASSLCLPNATWSHPPPQCKGHCHVRFDSITNGGVSCTNSHYHRSQCRFWCNSLTDDPLRLHGSPIVTCQTNGKWDSYPPCCARPCPYSAKIDLYFVLDSSETVGFKNWTKILEFVNQLIANFRIGTDGTQVGVIRYNRDVDRRAEIPLGRFQTLSSLQHAIRFLPYGGWGTNTGRALRYLSESSLASSSNRPNAGDYVILITDGASQDDVITPATTLKSKATTYVIGVGDVNQPQLRAIASKPSYVHMPGRNFLNLNDQLVSNITEKLCENPCLMENHWRNQTLLYTPEERS